MNIKCLLLAVIFVCTPALAEQQDTNTEAGVSEQSLTTDLLPALTPEMMVMLLLENGATKPELIMQLKALALEGEKAQKSNIKAYSYRTEVVPVTQSSGVAGKVTFQPGRFTTVKFIDSMGRALDVLASKPASDAFLILEESELGVEELAEKINRNHLIIRAQEDFETANMVVYLDGVKDPVVIELESGPVEVDVVKTFKFSGVMSSVARETLTKSATRKISYSEKMNMFLTQEPSDSVKVPVIGDGLEVFEYEGEYYVRTKHEIDAVYGEVAYGADGLRVYRILPENLYDRILFFVNGEPRSVDVVLDGFIHG